MQQSFLYQIIYHPKAVKDANGNVTQPPSQFIKEMTQILADTEAHVQITAARQIPEEHLIHLNEIEIKVSTF